MSKDLLRIPDYVEHILEAIRRIQQYTATMDQAGFQTNQQTQDAVIRNIEIIGEAVNHIRQSNPEFISQHSNIPWAVMRAMRNRVAHGYFEVDLDIVWKTIKDDFPVLEKQLLHLKASIGS